jgi:hypothetical protein
METEDGFYWTLKPEEFAATREKVAKLNARAAKRGFTGRLELVGERTEIKRSTAIGDVVEIVYRARIDGDAPKYNGWRLLATVDFIDTGLIVNTAPGVEKVDRSLVEQGKCDHCKQHRNRNKCYLVGNDNGEQLQVGSTCLKDFLGWDTLPRFIGLDDAKEDVDGFLSGGYWPSVYSTDSVLAAAWATIKLDGYVRAGEWNMTPTKQTVSLILDPPSKLARELQAKYGALQDESREIAKQTRDFVLSDKFAGDSEYVQNMKIALTSDTVIAKHFGLVVSAPQAWFRYQEKSLIREREKANTVNEWLGTEKERLRGLKVQVKAIRYIASDYGSTTLYTMVTDTGHQLKWFASSDVLGDKVTDAWFTIDGTVKKHEEWNGQKSTIVSRCKKLSN